MKNIHWEDEKRKNIEHMKQKVVEQKRKKEEQVLILTNLFYFNSCALVISVCSSAGM